MSWYDAIPATPDTERILNFVKFSKTCRVACVYVRGGQSCKLVFPPRAHAMRTRSGKIHTSDRRDAKRFVVCHAPSSTSSTTSAFPLDRLSEDERGLIWDFVVGRAAWMRARMDEAKGTKDAHISIGEWKKLHGNKKDHPLCTLRLVCKGNAKSLRSFVLMECRINSVFRIKKGIVQRRKSEEVFLYAFLAAFLYPFTPKGAVLTTPELRAEWAKYLLHVLAIRIANAVYYKHDRTAKNLYAALKNCVEHHLGDSCPGTGIAREPRVRKRIAMMLIRMARPVDLLGENVPLAANQRRRRPIAELINISSAHA